MRDFTDYMAIVMMRTGHYHLEHWKAKDPMVKRMTTFTHHGHKYRFDTQYAMTVHQWHPWAREFYGDPFSIVQWTMRTGLLKVGLLLYREPEDPLHGVEKAIPPMHISADAEGTDDSKDVGEYRDLSPLLCKGVILSPLYRNYRKKTHWGGTMSSRVLLYVVIVVVVVLVFILLNGTVTL